MVDWSATFKTSPIHIGYFPGSGGSRLRKLLQERSWDLNPSSHLHHNYEIEMDDFIKCPKPWQLVTDPKNIKPTPPVSREHLILISHCMDTALTRQVFPGRKILKIYANLHHSLRRWWVVYGKQNLLNDHGTDRIFDPLLSDSEMPLAEYVIKVHLHYYRRYMDCGHDHAVYIMPGEGEFSDFMLQRFEEDNSKPDACEFDHHWYSVAKDSRWDEHIHDPYLVDPGFCREQHQYHKSS